MPKVVIHPDFGGFSLSDEAVEILRQLGYHGDPYEIPRHDPRLLATVEYLGAFNASEDGDELRIVTIRGWRYIITEYDGSEGVMEPQDIEWITIR